MIESYTFGKIVIDGHEYENDLMILPDGAVVHPWWRKTSHELKAPDINPILEASPDFLVIGTGNPGMMRPDPILISDLRSRGIRVTALPTDRAAEEYDSLHRQGKKVSACFHLTC